MMSLTRRGAARRTNLTAASACMASTACGGVLISFHARLIVTQTLVTAPAIHAHAMLTCCHVCLPAGMTCFPAGHTAGAQPINTQTSALLVRTCLLQEASLVRKLHNEAQPQHILLNCQPSRHCVLAARKLGPEAEASFLDGTFLADRQTTVRCEGIRVHGPQWPELNACT